MRLGFHYHIPASRDAENRIRMPGYLGRFVDSLAERCEKVTCFLHVPGPGEGEGDYALQSANVNLVSLPPKGSVPHRAWHSGSMIAPILPFRDRLDVMLIRGPSPLLPTVARAAGNIPITLLLVGDYLAGLGSLPQPRWRKELIRLWSRWNKRGQDIVAANSLVIANNRLIYNEYVTKSRAAAEVWTTTLEGCDVVNEVHQPPGPEFRALYSGRMDSAKGLDDVVEALGMINRSGRKVGLDLVGWPEPGDAVLERIKARGRELRVDVVFHGFKPVGPELFACYDRADVFVMASRGSEGFPRTIFEAMARGVPVVASRVGDIPNRLRDRKHALLVEPKNPGRLAHAIEAVLSDHTLRRKLTDNGRLLAEGATLDKSTGRMFELIEEFIQAFGTTQSSSSYVRRTGR